MKASKHLSKLIVVVCTLLATGCKTEPPKALEKKPIGLTALESAKQFKSKETVELLKATKEDPGVLSREEIRKVVRKNLATLDPCYRRHHPDMIGWLNIEWVVDKSGKVVTTALKRNTSKKKDLADCVMEKIRRWRFPEPRGGGNVTVMYPFHFEGHLFF